MLTAKHISLNGSERVFEVASFRFEPGHEMFGQQGQSGTPPTIWVRYEPSQDESPVTGGTVFLMNSGGKTVARYDLGASPVPNIIGVNSDPHHSREYVARSSPATAGNPAAGQPTTVAA